MKSAPLFKNLVDKTLHSTTPMTVELKQKQNCVTKPFEYQILKNIAQTRVLSLVHPRSQLNYSFFYKNHANAITYLCSLSNYSIRAPLKIGSSMYSKEKVSGTKYKEINIDTLESELNNRYASSFFSYKGYNRIYKVYSDRRFLELEKKYSSMWLLDVANCFRSIYTHTIAWAVKSKSFSKKSIPFKNQIGSELDMLMQKSNDGETNGIPIGSEFSRIFAEIIFQKIDFELLEKLKIKFDFVFGRDYEILRYVDDYLLFGKSEEINITITNSLSDSLGVYNLGLAELKTKKYERPICTDKSHIINGLQPIIQKFEFTLFNTHKAEEDKFLFPKIIYKKVNFLNSIINRVKQVCKYNSGGYHDVSSYIISIFHKRAQKLIDTNETHSALIEDDLVIFRDAIIIVLDLMFFFFSVHPTVSSSNVLAKTIIMTTRYFKERYESELQFLQSSIIEKVNMLEFNKDTHEMRERYVSLEKLNVILATSDFGYNYRIESRVFENMLKGVELLHYFDIVSILYYIKNIEDYKHIMKIIEDSILFKLENGLNLEHDSESAHLFLDLLTCPYISNSIRLKLMNLFDKQYSICMSDSDKQAYLQEALKSFWFVKWEKLDILKLLERKELRAVY